MSYSNLEILSGVLIVACILLFYCSYNKPAVDGMKHGKVLPGLHMRDGYSALPKAGSFEARDGYTVGHLNDPSLSYTTRSSYFVENFKDKKDEDEGLNGRETRPTPASANVAPPKGNESNILWMPDAEVALDVYTRDGHLNSHHFDPNEEIHMWNTIFERNKDRVQKVGAGSLSGSAMQYIDYGGNMQPTRLITM